MRWFTENEEVFELWKPGEMSNDLKISHKKALFEKIMLPTQVNAFQWSHFFQRSNVFPNTYLVIIW